MYSYEGNAQFQSSVSHDLSETFRIIIIFIYFFVKLNALPVNLNLINAFLLNKRIMVKNKYKINK